MHRRANPVTLGATPRTSEPGSCADASGVVLRGVHRGLVAVAVGLALVALAGCGKEDNAAGEGPGPVSPESAAAPQVEGTGVEPPLPTKNNPPAVTIVSLPIGGGADDSTSEHQCVGASWLGDEIPDGVSILVTHVWLDPDKGVFAFSSSRCAGPSCRSSFAFTPDVDTCYVAVDAKGSPGATARLHLDGTVRCPATQRTLCEAVKAKAKKQSILLEVPEPQPDDKPTDVRPSPSAS